MKSILHERPGVYSSYDASAVVRGGRAARTIGVAAKSTSGAANTAVRLTSYEMGLSAFGEDAAGSPGMSAILKLLFLGGASTVVAVRVEGEDYAAAFAAMPKINWAGHCMYCGHCAPCPQGIGVADVTKFLNLCQAQGDIPETVREHYAALPHKAGECVQCGACEKRCPFGVAVTENMKRAAALFGA